MDPDPGPPKWGRLRSRQKRASSATLVKIYILPTAPSKCGEGVAFLSFFLSSYDMQDIPIPIFRFCRLLTFKRKWSQDLMWPRQLYFSIYVTPRNLPTDKRCIVNYTIAGSIFYLLTIEYSRAALQCTLPPVWLEQCFGSGFT